MANENEFRFEMDEAAVMRQINDAADRALTAVGEHMKVEIAEGRHGDTHQNVTGEYARSIGYSKPSGSNSKRTIKIGSSLQRALYYEYGTGNKAEKGGGRTTPWWYRDSSGKWVKTSGSRPSKRIRYAFRDEKNEIKNIIRDEMKRVGRGGR